MAETAFKTIKPGSMGTSLFEDRKSLFYGYAVHVECEEEAVEFRHGIKEQLPDARHYVSAFRLHENGLEFFSDAKEPHGTAGMPVLNVLKGHELQDSFIVVARIFGGTLLGKGGLMRAYTKAATGAVEDAVIALKTPSCEVSITIEYPLYEIVKNRLGEMSLPIQSESFTDKVSLSIFALPQEAAVVAELITNLSAGKAIIEIGPEQLRFL